MHECYDTLRSIAARARDEESAGTRGAARGQALAPWVHTWRAHPNDQRMAVDARNSTRQRLLFFVAKFETQVEVHRLHHRGLRIPSLLMSWRRVCLGGDSIGLSIATASHGQRSLCQAVGEKEWGPAFRKCCGHLCGSEVCSHVVNTVDANLTGRSIFDDLDTCTQRGGDTVDQ